MSDRQKSAVQPSRIVDEERVHSAMEYLRSSAQVIGKAKGRAVKADKMLSHTEALCIVHSTATSQAAKQAEARASDKYVAAIDEIQAAVDDLKNIESLREAASAVIDVWRTEQATHRATRF